MTHYLRLEFRARLVPGTPRGVLEALRSATGPDGPGAAADAPPFPADMLRSTSAHHPTRGTRLVREADRDVLEVSTSQNYGRGFEEFLDWIMPWTEDEDSVLGYIGEESDGEGATILVRRLGGLQRVAWTPNYGGDWPSHGGGREAEAPYPEPAGSGAEVLSDASVAAAADAATQGGWQERDAAAEHLMHLTQLSGAFADAAGDAAG